MPDSNTKRDRKFGIIDCICGIYNFVYRYFKNKSRVRFEEVVEPSFAVSIARRW